MPEPLILASASPRRLETLQSLGFSVTTSPADADETIFDHLPVAARVRALAELKAKAGAELAPGPARWVVGADTLVAVGGRVLGKPSGIEEARDMLMALSGRRHVVASGVCVLDRERGRLKSAVSETTVSFVPLRGHEIEAYLASGEWRGVAGAYRIQEKAAFFIDRIEGSFSGVVGLPLREFYDILARIGYPFRMAGETDAATP